VAEARFIEAIWLLWQWTDGRFLLSEAGKHGVGIFAGETRGFASYSPFTRVIRVGTRWTEVSTWMLADVIGHELRHAADDHAGLRVGLGLSDCIEREQMAYQTERSFLVWLSNRFGGIPSPSSVVSRLSYEDYLLYSNLYDIGTSQDVNFSAYLDYRKVC